MFIGNNVFTATLLQLQKCNPMQFSPVAANPPEHVHAEMFFFLLNTAVESANCVVGGFLSNESDMIRRLGFEGMLMCSEVRLPVVFLFFFQLISDSQ